MWVYSCEIVRTIPALDKSCRLFLNLTKIERLKESKESSYLYLQKKTMLNCYYLLH